MNAIFDTFKTSVAITVTIFGIWYAILNSSVFWIPLGFFPALVLCIGVYFLRIPRPSSAQVQRVVGKCLSSDLSDPDSELVTMKAIAHRGAGLDAPENTLNAFKMCADKGCNFIEFDIALTADEVPVVFHDDNVERLSSYTWIINKSLYENLMSVDVSEKHPLRERYGNSQIPTLDETVKLLLFQNQHMFIDIKDNNQKMVKVILDLFNTYPTLLTRAVVSSFYPHLIYLIRRGNPDIVCSLAYRPYYFSYKGYLASTGLGERRSKSWYKHRLYIMLDALHFWFLPRITYYILGISLVLLHKDCISPQDVQLWTKKGVRVVAWTVNHPVDKQYFSRQLKCSYITDTLVGENSTHLTSSKY